MFVVSKEQLVQLQ